VAFLILIDEISAVVIPVVARALVEDGLYGKLV
jgi:hypothetical protein